MRRGWLSGFPRQLLENELASILLTGGGLGAQSRFWGAFVSQTSRLAERIPSSTCLIMNYRQFLTGGLEEERHLVLILWCQN